MQQIVASQQANRMGGQSHAYKKPGAQQMTTPGPGHYSEPDLLKWVKKSYN